MDKVEVYHGGTEIVESPLCNAGRAGLDFGPGFYVTDIYQQAVEWANTQADRRNRKPLLNVYLFDRAKCLSEARSKIFTAYDEEWLDFVVGCRMETGIWKDFDYVEGGVADDRVINTVSMYMKGYYSKERALSKLTYLRPNNQICFLNQELVNKYLKFEEAFNL
jgi:hypothetical protein